MRRGPDGNLDAEIMIMYWFSGTIDCQCCYIELYNIVFVNVCNCKINNNKITILSNFQKAL